MHRLLPVLFALLLSPLAARAEQVTQAASPDGRIVVQLDINGEGRLAYRVLRDGKPVIEDSRLGLQLVNGRQLLRNLTLAKQATSSFDETWEQPWGEQRWIRNHYNELRAGIVERDRDQRRFDVVFRIYDDGLGFRYELPRQPALTRVEIGEELTEFAIARPATAWWSPAFESNREEYPYNRTPVEQVGDAQTPVTLRLEDGTHLSIHEAALVDYAGMNLSRVEGRRLKVQLTPSSGPGKVRRETPFNTPWRTVQIASRAGGLVDSSLILNLNEPNAIGDVSW